MANPKGKAKRRLLDDLQASTTVEDVNGSKRAKKIDDKPANKGKCLTKSSKLTLQKVKESNAKAIKNKSTSE